MDDSLNSQELEPIEKIKSVNKSKPDRPVYLTASVPLEDLILQRDIEVSRENGTLKTDQTNSEQLDVQASETLRINESESTDDVTSIPDTENITLLTAVHTQLEVTLVEFPEAKSNLPVIMANLLTIVNSAYFALAYINKNSKYMINLKSRSLTKYSVLSVALSFTAIFIGAHLAGFWSYPSWFVFNAGTLFMNYRMSRK
jgi:hypothetical protein